MSEFTRVGVAGAVLLAATVCAAKGILPCQVMRRGLTNEQIDFILQKHPDAELRVSAQDWRGMKYQLKRFENMTNYVEQVGGSNDCARLILNLTDDSERLSTSNGFLRIAVRDAERRVKTWAEAYDSATNAFNTATNYIADLQVDLTAATNRAAIAEAAEAIAEAKAAAAERRAARLDAFRDYLVEQRDKAVLPSTKAIYQALIDKIDEKTGGK